AKYDFKTLQKLCNVGPEDIRHMIEEIKTLNPKPGNAFQQDIVQVMQPDVFLKHDANGGWQLELNADTLPKVLVNRRYYSQIAARVKDKESKKFLSEQLNTANWLVKALDQRANT